MEKKKSWTENNNPSIAREGEQICKVSLKTSPSLRIWRVEWIQGEEVV